MKHVHRAILLNVLNTILATSATLPRETVPGADEPAISPIDLNDLSGKINVSATCAANSENLNFFHCDVQAGKHVSFANVSLLDYHQRAS